MIPVKYDSCGEWKGGDLEGGLAPCRRIGWGDFYHDEARAVSPEEALALVEAAEAEAMAGGRWDRETADRMIEFNLYGISIPELRELVRRRSEAMQR